MNSNNRASLLSGLRTGGVRSASGPIAPHTAAIGGSFQIPRFASGHHQAPLYEEPSDFQSLHYAHNPLAMPMTAGLVDGLTPRFSQQQQQAPHNHQAQHHQLLRQAQIAAMSGMQGFGQPMDPNQHLLQMQFMQAMVLQQQQAQRLQAEIALQQQVAMSLAVQQEQQHIRTGSRIPSTAGPTQTTFDQRIPVPQMRNLRLDAHNNADDIGPVPMTAALGGKFGGRPTSNFKQSDEQSSSSTVVISGGVSLGAPSQTQTTAPSKSDAATSWRRGSAAVGSTRNVSPPKLEPTIATPTVTVSAPEESSKPSPTDPATVLPKYRPQPLRIHNGSVTNSTPTLVVESDDGQSAVIAGPPSPASSQSSLEAPAKRYDGLGIGRPVVVAPATATVRASQPVRQPRGPPAGADDLGSKNFATRIKRTVVVPMKEAAIVEAY